MVELKLRGARKLWICRDHQGHRLDVEDREFVVFVGLSGCGKSTLLRMIAGGKSATATCRSMACAPTTSTLPSAGCLVFQSYALYPQPEYGLRAEDRRCGAAERERK